MKPFRKILARKQTTGVGCSDSGPLAPAASTLYEGHRQRRVGPRFDGSNFGFSDWALHLYRLSRTQKVCKRRLNL